MSFAALWPLAFLAAVPLIIILYILKPRGKDTEVSSHLLWRKLIRERQSKTFWEKLRAELLLYLQLMITVLLILALMAPYVLLRMQGAGSSLLLIDTTLSMQHRGEDGRTRLEEAKRSAIDYVNAASGEITVMTVSAEAQLVVARSTDHALLWSVIEGITPTQTEGALSDAYPMAADMDMDAVVIYTDGDGAGTAELYTEQLGAQVVVCGDASNNVSLDYAAAGAVEADRADVSVRYTNYADAAVTMDVTLYDAAGTVVGLRSVAAEAGASGSVVFTEMPAEGAYLRAELSNIRYADGRRDALAGDDTAYALLRRAGNGSGLLISRGNTFIERAYYAATGEDLSKAETDAAALSGGYTMAIYDAGYAASSGMEEESGLHRLLFASEGEETLTNVVVSVKECELTKGLGDFTIGANQVQVYSCPEWAMPFLEVEGKCVGYYGVSGARREVVVGFDLRETEFPVKAEFPVFIAETVQYLTSLSLLAKDSYLTGEQLLCNPAALVDLSKIEIIRVNRGEEEPVRGLEEAGLYLIRTEEREEYCTVQLPYTGRDGRAVAESVRGDAAQSKTLGRRGLRNVLLAAAFVLLVLEWLVYMRKVNYRRRFYLYARIALLLLLVLSLLGLRLRRRSREATTIFLVDLSVSNAEHRELFADYIDDALREMPKDNSYGIVTFGRDAVVDQFLTDRDMYMGLNTRTDGTATNYELALQRAVSMLPPDASGRILVLTDGKETAGDIERTAALFRSGEISLEAILLDTSTGDDTYIREVSMPEVLHAGESYYMTVTVESSFETEAVIEIYSGERLVASEAVHLIPGSNPFVFEESVSGDEVESYEVRVLAEGDSCAENDRYSAYARVEDAPRILVLRGKDEDPGAFMNLLSAAHINAEFTRADRAPDTLTDLLEYKAVILENVYYDELPEGFLEQLESYVRDYGGGLICCGGEDSYMLGGYNETVLEKLLPVNMELRGTVELPSTAIVMVIDHSGSMSTYAGHGATYLDVAVEAAKRAVDNLRPTDEVGVLAFDDRYAWTHVLSKVDDPAAIKRQIERITDGGGTVIKPALETALAAIRQSRAQVRHIILLTDGYGETNDFSSVTQQMVREGITMSTVAVGEYSDQALMERLAEDAGGRYYYADGGADIPRIFAQEVYLGGDTYLKNGTYGVRQTAPSELTSGLFPDGWYELLGYVAATPKAEATQLLASSQGDPLLTVWQYGLGKAVAWTSDVDGGWNAAYVGTEDYAALWKRLTDYATGTPDIGADYLEVDTENGRTTLTYHTESYADGTAISGLYSAPDGGGDEISFLATEPGVYTAELDSELTGLYHINVRRSDDGEVTGAFTTAAVVQYSDEYRFDVSADAFRGFINRYGRWLGTEDYLWEKLYTGKNASFSLTELLLSLLLLLYLLDIAGRRFGIDPELPRRRRRTVLRQPTAEAEAGSTEAISAAEGTESASEAAPSAGADDKAKRSAGRRKGGTGIEEPAALDTSALLQKKRDRNI